ncbi:MAG: T9SS C-terminal target domain-containing protein, partial [Bacteroidetes bacterium]
KISSNNALVNLEGLDQIDSIGTDITIEYNQNLSDLSGFESITSLGGIRIQHSHALTTLNGLEQIPGHLSEGIRIADNSQLNSLEGLNHLTMVEGNVYIGQNPSLTSLTALHNLQTVEGQLYIGQNPQLLNLSGLEELSGLGSLSVGYNDNLLDINGLIGITRTEKGSCTIRDNSSLIDLSGLNNLTAIAGGLYITGNSVLNSIEALENLQSVRDYLYLDNNDNLTSLAGLQNISPDSLIYLQIGYSENLSDCSIESLCNYLQDSGNEASITNNSTGCNSRGQILEACEITSYEDRLHNFGDYVKLFPNPATESLTIQIENLGFQNTQLILTNSLGQKVWQDSIAPGASAYKNTIVISENGLYFFQVRGEVNEIIKTILVSR